MQDTLKRMMIEPERIRMVDLNITDGAAYAGLIEDFVASLRSLGPSPFKV
jgi:coenzyme F420-reducing hydrogenase delta subunit